jgi:hypothetical protein
MSAVGSPGVVWRETEGQIVLLDVEASVYFGLNGTGAGLWKRLTEGATRDELTSMLMRGSSVGREQAGSDVDDFLADLRRHGLLRKS